MNIHTDERHGHVHPGTRGVFVGDGPARAFEARVEETGRLVVFGRRAQFNHHVDLVGGGRDFSRKHGFGDAKNVVFAHSLVVAPHHQ